MWLEERGDESDARDDTLRRVRALYEFRHRRFSARAGEADDEDGIEERSMAYQRLMHRLERELDLEESRLEV